MSCARFLTVCLNPVLQKTLSLGVLGPSRVNRLSAHRLDASGKGINVSRVLQQLDQPVVHLTQLGGRFRGTFLELCAADGLSIEWCESGAEIRFCYTVLESDLGRTTELVEEGPSVEPGTEERLGAAFLRLLGDCDWVVFSGSKAAGFSEGLFARWAAEARRLGKGVVLDYRGEDLRRSLESFPRVIKPNLEEFVATFFDHRPGVAELLEAVESKMRQLASEFDIGVVVTRGEADTLVADGRECYRVPVTPVKGVNTTGSGDAFAAGLTLALARGAALREAVLFGQRCGADNAGLLRPGVIR